jgi:type IV pilus assembly protein PilC
MAASRTLAIFSNLLEAGATVDRAMVFSIPLMANLELEERMLRANRALLNGSLFSEALERHEVFPTLAVHLFKVAEESGGMAEISKRMAMIFEREVENALDTASTLVEPLALLFVGGFVGVILLATLLPTVNVMGQL